MRESLMESSPGTAALSFLVSNSLFDRGAARIWWTEPMSAGLTVLLLRYCAPLLDLLQ